MSTLLPRAADRKATPWLAIVATPLVFATDSLAHAALIVLVMAAAMLFMYAAVRFTRSMQEDIRYCILLIVAAGMATVTDLVLLAYTFPMYRTLNLLAPVMLATLFMHATHPSQQHDDDLSAYTQLGVTLLLLGIGRELVGHGSLLHDIPGSISMSLFPPEMGFF